MVGKPEKTVRAWICRGLAHPTDEPYGSFARQYCKAERGLANAIAQSSALRVFILGEQLKEYQKWRERGAAPRKPEKPDAPKDPNDELEQAIYAEEQAAYKAAMADWNTAMLAWETPPPHPSTGDMVWMERIREQRFPDDYGTSQHRKPELEHSADEWFESHGLQTEQLAALFHDPPETIRAALVQSADSVYKVLLAGGFDPATRKADDEVG